MKNVALPSCSVLPASTGVARGRGSVLTALGVCALLLAGILAGPAARAQTFDDVPTNHWAYAFIEELARRGVTSGCGNGDYCPDATVTRAQMAVFLIRAMATTRVIDGNDAAIGVFVENSGEGGGTELMSFLTEEGYLVRELNPATGELNRATVFYMGSSCTGTAYVVKHAGSVIRSLDSIYYVDRSAAAVTGVTTQSYITGSTPTCDNFPVVHDVVWPLTPNVESTTGVPDSAYLTPITLDWR